MRKKSDLLTVTKRQPISNGIVKAVVTVLGCGYTPILPGTAASLCGVLFFWAVKDHFFIYGVSLVLVLCLGFVFITRAEKFFQRKDDTRIVIDEVFGILLCFWGIVFIDINLVLMGFLIFRLLDILKPPPARHFEKLEGAKGVMLDDFVAALYTNLILRLILKFC